MSASELAQGLSWRSARCTVVKHTCSTATESVAAKIAAREKQSENDRTLGSSESDASAAPSKANETNVPSTPNALEESNVTMASALKFATPIRTVCKEKSV